MCMHDIGIGGEGGGGGGGQISPPPPPPPHAHTHTFGQNTHTIIARCHRRANLSASKARKMAELKTEMLGRRVKYFAIASPIVGLPGKIVE